MDSPSAGNTGSIPVVPHDILVKQEQGQAISIWLIGAFCIFVWELIICAPNEYRLVWKKPMNSSSLLYLSQWNFITIALPHMYSVAMMFNEANRYFGLIGFCFTVSLTTDIWSPSACKRVYLVEPIGALISTILSQAILGGRVFAIYSRNKILGYVLAGILLAEAVVGAISSSTTSPPLSIPGAPPGSQPPCGALRGPVGWLITYWTMPLLFDSLTFLLTAWKAYNFWKKDTQLRLFNIIWFDGLLYFFANLAMNVANVMIFFLAPSTLQDFNMSPTIKFQVILSCRMFLHLKGSDQPTDFTIDKHNNIKFRSYISNRVPYLSNGMVSNSCTQESREISGVIQINEKRETVIRPSQAYELDVQVGQSESQPEQWDIA